jgi:isopentenyl-diphosphate delta-isomerase
MVEDRLILVDIYDNPIGSMGKLETHQKSLLHRAFSVFLYHEDKLLIQQRSFGKYHSAGLWANTCCSHPREGEKLADAVARRLEQEAGISCETEELFSFVYHAEYSNGLCEYEYDHVFIGEYDGGWKANPEEIAQMKWITIEELEKDLLENPRNYAKWFLIAAPKVMQKIKTML